MQFFFIFLCPFEGFLFPACQFPVRSADTSLPFQLSFINRRSRSRNKYRVNIPQAQDDFNSVRAEFTGMLKNQIARSNNGIERSKYITFGLPADGIGEARPRLERVEADVTGNLKRLGVPSEPLDGRSRLALLHSQMHPGSREPFRFSWQDIPKTGLGTKDYIAPDSFDFRQSRLFRVGQYWGAASYLQIMASELSDKLLAEILELDAELTVTMHIQTVDQLKAIKTVKGKLSDIGKMKVEEQRKAVRAGYDPDILPPDLITFSKDAAELLADLEGRTLAVQSTTKPEELFLTDASLPALRDLYCFEDRELIYTALGKGYVDAIAAHEVSILQYMQDYNTEYRILDEPLQVVRLGVAFGKNDVRGLETQLTATLDEMRADGTLAAIIGKYLANPEKFLEVDGLVE